VRTFVLDSPDKMTLLGKWIRAYGFSKPLAVTVAEHKSKRSNEQNRLMWDRLTAISEQARPGGSQFSTEAWHEHAKRELLPEECAKGVSKWAYLPTGDRVLKMSTTDLDVSEMTDYLDALGAMAAELGVELVA